MEGTLWSRELCLPIAASLLSRDQRGQERELDGFGAQHWWRLACQGTIPKEGALALHLRSSDIPTTHKITHSPMERTQGGDKMKHRWDSSSGNTQWRTGMHCASEVTHRLHQGCPHGVTLSHQNGWKLSTMKLQRFMVLGFSWSMPQEKVRARSVHLFTAKLSSMKYLLLTFPQVIHLHWWERKI
jgi:hypothetical protein